jgi:preprotein translocase subunit SecE
MFLCGGLLLFYLLQWSVDWVWGAFAPAPDELFLTVASGIIAITVGIWLYRNDRVHGLAEEVTAELRKVTWPSAKEVRAATMVVIGMAIIAAVILGTFDFVWSQLTELVYG